MFSVKRPVTYSEVGCDFKTDMAQIIDYLQDVTCMHSNSIGVGVEELYKRGMAWILNSWQIVVDRYPEYTEEITVKTWPYQFKASMGLRNCAIEDAKGGLIVRANATWALVDFINKCPVRIDKEQIEGYVTEPKLEMPYDGRKIKFKGEFEAVDRVKVMRAWLDSNSHVNNARYVELAMEYLPKDYQIEQVRVEYREMAVYGDTIYVEKQAADDKNTILLKSEAGSIYAVTEFTAKKSD